MSVERMWVEIISRNGDQFRGRLKNTPNFIPDLAFDDELDFLSCHVNQTQREESIEPPAERYAVRCFVTKKVIDEGCSVNYLARDEIDEEGQRRNFSRWTLNVGDETDEYLDNHDNWCFVSLGLVLNIDDRFRPLLDAEHTVGKEFFWMIS